MDILVGIIWFWMVLDIMFIFSRTDPPLLRVSQVRSREEAQVLRAQLEQVCLYIPDTQCMVYLSTCG